MAGKLEGKVAVITGGASGMGLATVERFVAEGAKVVFCDIPPGADEELERRLGPVKASVHHKERQKGGPHDGWVIADRLGDAAHFVPADVSEKAQLAEVIDAAVSRFGGLDVMYNNAGIAAPEGDIINCSEEIFDRNVEVNLKAIWLGIKLSAPHLIARGGGSIISTASMAATDGLPGLGAYSATKAGILGLTRSACAELGPKKVRVNCICPGGICTPIPKATFGNFIDPDALRPMLAAGQPIPRAGEGYDIAGAALWLASDDSSFVSGQIFGVDGGGSAVAYPGGMQMPDELSFIDGPKVAN